MKIFILVFISFLAANCNGQKKDTIMTTEKFDVETYAKRVEEVPKYENGDIITMNDSTRIHQSLSAKGGASEVITPPKLAFYKIRKSYFKSTNTLEYKGRVIGNMKIGVWQFFDEKGNFLEKEKRIDIKSR